MNRIKQLIWALQSIFKKIDYTLVDKYLNEKEKKYFLKLSKGEQSHSIRVCIDAMKIADKFSDIDINKLSKISLLHDIGKTYQRLNLIEKSIIVILAKLTNDKIKKYSSIKKIYIYYNHSFESVKILKSIDDYDSDFIYAILKHHEREVINKNKYLDILIESDNRN